MEEKKYKAIYKCRLCEKEFESGSVVICRFSDLPTAPTLKHHKCKDGRYGCGDLLGTYEVDA